MIPKSAPSFHRKVTVTAFPHHGEDGPRKQTRSFSLLAQAGDGIWFDPQFECPVPGAETSEMCGNEWPSIQRNKSSRFSAICWQNEEYVHQVGQVQCELLRKSAVTTIRASFDEYTKSLLYG
jgi:hypothetical protein